MKNLYKENMFSNITSQFVVIIPSILELARVSISSCKRESVGNSAEESSKYLDI